MNVKSENLYRSYAHFDVYLADNNFEYKLWLHGSCLYFHRPLPRNTDAK